MPLQNWGVLSAALVYETLVEKPLGKLSLVVRPAMIWKDNIQKLLGNYTEEAN